MMECAAHAQNLLPMGLQIRGGGGGGGMRAMLLFSVLFLSCSLLFGPCDGIRVLRSLVQVGSEDPDEISGATLVDNRTVKERS